MCTGVSSPTPPYYFNRYFPARCLLFLKHPIKWFYLLPLCCSWWSTPLSTPPANNSGLPIKALQIEEKGADPLGNAAEYLAINSHLLQPCSLVLAASLPLPGSHPALICVVPSATISDVVSLHAWAWAWSFRWAAADGIFYFLAETTDGKRRSQLYLSACRSVNRPGPFFLFFLLWSFQGNQRSLLVILGNAFIRLPGALCKSWLRVRDRGT